MPAETPEIAVVIPTYNRASLLEGSLRSLTEQTLAPDRFEVLVVDDGSTDATGDVCQTLSAHLPLRYWRLGHAGISAAKNLAVSVARAPLILFFDDDDLAHPELLAQHLASHAAHPDPRVAVLGYTTWAPHLAVSPLMEYVTEIGQHLFAYPSLVDGAELDYTYFWGGRSSCKRSLLVRNGLFDQRFLTIYEDIELGYRLARSAGLKVIFNRSAISYMNRPVDYEAFCQRSERQGRGKFYFSQVQPDPVVQRYCEVDGALERWAGARPQVASVIDRVRFLEQHPDPRTVPELHALYGWSFAAFKAAGIALESGVAPAEDGVSHHFAAARRRDPSTATASLLAPSLSIIVRVGDGVEETRQCLQALASHSQGIAADIVLVDASTTPEMRALLNQLTGQVKIISAAAGGLVAACNQAVAETRGTHVALIDYRATVTPGSLQRLLSHLAHDADAAAVGPMLVTHTGRVHAAGGAIDPDGRLRPLGAHAEASEPSVTFVREVDYLPGAALIVRREAWEAVGGLDVRYTSFEVAVAGLATALREAGGRCAYQPEARVTLSPGGHPGLAPRGTERQRLREQHARLRSRASDVGKRILVIDPLTPIYDRASGSRRLFELLKIMVNDGHQVTFIARNGLGQERYVAELRQMGIETYATDPERLRQLGVAVEAPAIHLPELLRRNRFDLAVLSFFDVAEQYLPDIRRYSPRTHILIDTVDVHCLREARQAALYQDQRLAEQAARTRLREMDIYRRADGLIAITPDEQRALAELAPGVECAVVPNIHVPLISADHTPAWADRQGLLFVGNFRHLPNQDAMLYFCSQVLPRIRDRLANVHLTIVGDAPPPAIQALASADITVTGYVTDTLPYLQSRRVSIAPLRYGAGLKGKIGEALSAGLPVVTTSIGTEGMQLEPGQDVLLVADTAEAFAEAVCRVVTDETLWRRLSQTGQSHVAATYSPAVVAASIRAVIAGAGPSTHVLKEAAA